MRFCSIGSGSRGNGTLLEWDDTCLLVDCGFLLAETEARLAQRQRSAAQLSAILVTHEHGDHIRGVAALSRRYGIPVYMTRGTWRGYGRDDIPTWQCISAHEPFCIGALSITPVAVPHDSREPCQFIASSPVGSVGVLTDLGSITPHVVSEYSRCDALVLEFNHDEQLLRDGPYPPSVRQRVAGDWGHLSNRQAAALLQRLPVARLQHLVVAHVSETNNTPTHAREALAALPEQPAAVHWAAQQDGCDWLGIG